MSVQELKEVIKLVKTNPPDFDAPLELARAQFDGMLASFPVPGDIRFEEVSGTSVRGIWAVPPNVGGNRTLIYAHGGGFLFGTAKGFRTLAGELGRAAQARVLIVDYRRAPEHAAPAALEDVVNAYKWLMTEGVSATNIALVGDSAGGGLVLSAALRITNEGLPQPGCSIGLSPWIDLTCESRSMEMKRNDDPLTSKGMLLQMASAYLQGRNPSAVGSELLQSDLTGICPVFLQVGSSEVLADDSLRFAERASTFNVSATVEIWPKMIHVWHLFSPMLSEAREALETAGMFVRRHTLPREQSTGASS